jgi:hypothetical protein
MKRITLVALLCLAPATGLAGTWPGFLVDSKCYEAEERNRNPTTTLEAVNRDRDEEIRYCRPRAKTRSFTFVDRDGISFKLDPGVNARAADLVRNSAHTGELAVEVTGEKTGNTIKVDTISPAK